MSRRRRARQPGGGHATAQSRVAAIVEGANDPIIGCSLDGYITSWNAAAERLLGYRADEALGRSLTLMLAPETHGLVDEINTRLRWGQAIATQESPQIARDGSVIHVSSNVSAVHDAEGALIGAAIILRDVSGLVRSREHLERKVRLNALLQALARRANESSTPEAALQSCLHVICEYGAWDVGHLVRFRKGAPRPASLLLQMTDPGLRVSLVDAMRRGESANASSPFIPRLMQADEAIWLADLDVHSDVEGAVGLSAKGMRCAFGFPVVSAGTTLAVLEFFATHARAPDELLLEHMQSIAGQLARVIERHQFVADIARSEQHLRAILDSEPACVKVVDANGVLLSMNQAGLTFVEAGSVEEARARGLINLIAPEHRVRFSESLRRTLKGENCHLEFEVIGLKGARRWVESNTTPFVPEDGAAVAMLAVTRDITDRKYAEQRAHHLAHHDALTGLPNRTLFRDRVGVAIAHAKRRGEWVGALIIDLDRFRKFNESLGYDGGDELLREVAGRIAATLNEADTLARVGADELAILVEGLACPEALHATAEKAQRALAAPLVIKGREIFVTASIGAAAYPANALDAHTLLEAAERAVIRVKQDGGAGYHASEGSLRSETASEFNVEAALRNAVRDGELRVHYQPKIDFRTSAITGAEALLRWTSPELGVMSPAQFIPIAEGTGLIVPIGAWVLRTACAQAAAWHRAGHPIDVAVNLSPRQFRQNDLASVVAGALAAAGLPPESLELEITEGTAMSNPAQAAQVLNELHEIGVRLSVDDFGTGYSSLNYLRQFPLDCLKIDRSFVDEICTSSSDEAIVRATIALGHSLQLKVVAEGVETERQHAQLALMGCDQGQGFLYSPAVDALDLEALLQRPGRVMRSAVRSARG